MVGEKGGRLASARWLCRLLPTRVERKLERFNSVACSTLEGWQQCSKWTALQV